MHLANQKQTKIYNNSNNNQSKWKYDVLCYFTFTLHQVDKFWAVAVTDQLLLHAETPDICNFFHIRQILVFVVHPPVDSALPLKTRGFPWQNGNTRGKQTLSAVTTHLPPCTAKYDWRKNIYLTPNFETQVRDHIQWFFFLIFYFHIARHYSSTICSYTWRQVQ